MANNFFSLSEVEQAGLIRQAADQLGLSDVIIEKDIWVCWLLANMFSLPIKMAFKGGTSLSKVFGLIERFSEDCDMTIDYHHFKPDLDLENSSRTQLKKVSEQLKEQLRIYVLESLLPDLKEKIFSAFNKKTFDLTLSEDGEQLRFYYPSVISTLPGYLRDHVFVEFGIRNSTEPCKEYQVTSYLEQALDKNLGVPKPFVNTLSPIRTFWEKATLIHVECHRDRPLKTPERLSRHWYDLFMLNRSWVGEQALLNGEILKSVIDYKKAFFNASYTHYDDCLSGKFRLIPENFGLESLKKDFFKMIEAGMFHKLPPKFDEVIRELENLERLINSSQF